MTGIGPVEPVNSSTAENSYDVIGIDESRLTDRLADRLTAHWTRLSPPARRATLAAALAVLATAATVLLLPQPTNDPAPAAPVPWPANVTSWRYLGLAAPLNTDRHATSGRFHFAIAVDHGPPVTLEVTGAAFDGLTAHALPAPAFTVAAATTRRTTVVISVSDCSGLPLNADLPFLDVTLRNTRAIQHHSFIFGNAFARDLSALLHGACDPHST